MTQEVRVMLQLTLDVNAKYSKEEIKKAVEYALTPDSPELEYDETIPFDIQMVDIIEIKEEAEIYGNV